MAKIDTSKIEGYDSMSAEDKLKALEEYEYEDNADELENQKKIFADNLRQHNRNEILFENKPIPLKKPFKVKWREFINKLKIVFGA